MAATRAKRTPKRATAKRKTKRPMTKKRSVKKKQPANKKGTAQRTARRGAGGRSRRSRAGGGTATTNPPSNNQSTAMGNGNLGPSGIRVRMYRVGFGDFFLLSLRTAAGPKHILIDCGVHACDIKTIHEAVTHMAEETGHNLSLVIMTHRHADHISGFAKCQDIFAQFNVEQVWMSWFEDPKDEDASKFQSSLTMVAQQLKMALAARSGSEDDELTFMAENITGEALPLGAAASGGSNGVALKVLHGGFKNQAPVSYYKGGDAPTLPKDLVDAGLRAQILGPPHDLDLVKQMSGKNEQFLTDNDPDVAAPIQPFDGSLRVRGDKYPPEAFQIYGRKAIEQAVVDSQPDMLAAKARQADNTLNNQSLVVLFTFNGKNLLFAGDAQWGNWENFLYGGKIGTGHSTLTDTSRKILSSLDFYKVGHHGSTNATPKDALDAMREGVVAMVSTQPGCYGSTKSGNEVPHIPLLEAIEKKSDNQLARSDQIEVKTEAGSVEPPSKDLGALGKPFSAGDGYIDYAL